MHWSEGLHPFYNVRSIPTLAGLKQYEDDWFTISKVSIPSTTSGLFQHSFNNKTMPLAEQARLHPFYNVRSIPTFSTILNH